MAHLNRLTHLRGAGEPDCETDLPALWCTCHAYAILTIPEGMVSLVELPPCPQCQRPEELAPSDLGLDGARPLPPAEWCPTPDELVDDTAWAEQNRRINALLRGGDAP